MRILPHREPAVGAVHRHVSRAHPDFVRRPEQEEEPPPGRGPAGDSDLTELLVRVREPVEELVAELVEGRGRARITLRPEPVDEVALSVRADHALQRRPLLLEHQDHYRAGSPVGEVLLGRDGKRRLGGQGARDRREPARQQPAHETLLRSCWRVSSTPLHWSLPAGLPMTVVDMFGLIRTLGL